MLNCKKKVLAINGDVFSCGNFRVIQPFRALIRDYKDDPDLSFHLFSDEMENDTNSFELIEYLKEFSAVMIQRPASPKMIPIMEAIKANGSKLYIELDDALFNVHPSNPASTVWKPNSPSWNTLKRAIDLCDKLILSTEQLQEMYQKDSVVFWNALDVDMPIYSPENNRRHQLPKDKTIVGWAGSTSHIDSLRLMIKPIRKLVMQRDDVIFALCSNPEFLGYFDLPKEKCQYVKHKPFEEFPPVMSLFDISIATVRNDVFNSGKSELKVLEAGIWGVPSVCSYVAPYKRFAKNSDGGCLLVYENDVNEWVKTLTKLIDEPELRKNLAEKTQKAIQTTYNIKEINKKRVEFFKSELL